MGNCLIAAMARLLGISYGEMCARLPRGDEPPHIMEVQAWLMIHTPYVLSKLELRPVLVDKEIDLGVDFERLVTLEKGFIVGKTDGGISHATWFDRGVFGDEKLVSWQEIWMIHEINSIEKVL